MANQTAELDPQIIQDLVSLTRDFRAEKECKYLSARMIWEYYRATQTRRIKGNGEYTLNNNLLPLYSRAVMQSAPDLAGVFRTRRVRGSEGSEGAPTLEDYYAQEAALAAEIAAEAAEFATAEEEYDL